MEILINQPNTITLYGDAGWTVTASYTKDGVGPLSLSVTNTADKYVAQLPYVTEESIFEVTWNLNIPGQGTVVRKEKVHAVTPVLPIHEIKEMLDVDKTEAQRAEASVRHIINVHTGQIFGKSRGTYTLRGKGTSVMELPRKAIELFTVDGSSDLSQYEVIGDGFFLKYYQWGIPPVKADYHEAHMHVGGVIHNPLNVSLGTFKDGIGYRVNALWGYEQVPEEVQEAARLLIGVYADADTEYRDRYLTSMTAADWRIQFNQGAFLETGHVRADQLLAPYVLQRSWMVL